jgi:outer membrane lipoprotein SlyB
MSMPPSANYSIDQILQATQPPAQPSGFKRVLGGLLGGIGNIFAPGIGGMIGSAISGGLGGGIGGSGIMGSDPMQYLRLQQQMNMEARYYDTLSAIMKCRHDSSMSAIKNIQ